MTDIDAPTLGIGAVVARLQEEFPALRPSKIRFLDAQGVVSPRRAASGYRRYSERDIDRLRFVLRAQRDRFWPLKVIREALDAYDRGLTPDAEDGRPVVPTGLSAADDAPSPAQLSPGAHDLRLTPTELATATGITEATVADLTSFGLIRLREGHYRAGDLQVAQAAATLMSYGVQARHLRPFRLAADRELGLVEQLMIGPGRTDRAEVLRQCVALHVALVRAGLPAE